MKFERIKPGMVLLDIHSHTMGNTTMRELGLWKVHIISVDVEACTAVVSWNGNTRRTYYKRELERLREKPSKAYLAQVERRSRGGL